MVSLAFGVLAIVDYLSDSDRDAACLAHRRTGALPSELGDRRLRRLIEEKRSGRPSADETPIEQEVADFCGSGAGNPYVIPLVATGLLGVGMWGGGWIAYPRQP